MLAACEEGAGSQEFARMLAGIKSDRGFIEQITSAPVVVDQWQFEKLALVTTKAEVLFYVPGVPPEYQSHLWGRSFSTAPAALDALFSTLPPGAQIALIPEGPYVLTRLASLQ